jgi:hypothetical protein
MIWTELESTKPEILKDQSFLDWVIGACDRLLAHNLGEAVPEPGSHADRKPETVECQVRL